MPNINDSFIRIPEIMRNSILSFDVSADVRKSITRMNDQVRNIVKVYDSTLLMQNQREFIEMSSQITKQLRDSMKIMQDTLKAYDYNNPFDANIITEQITEAFEILMCGINMKGKS